MTYHDEWEEARLASIGDLTSDVRLFEIAPAQGARSYEPGSHINVVVIVGGEQQTRSYSLIGDPGADVYRIAVKRLPDGRGGSAYMWSLKLNARLTIARPRNRFELSTGDGEYLLMAGGIGITPIYGMALSLWKRRANFRLVYAARSHADMAFAEQLKDRLGDRLELCPEDRGGRIDLGNQIGRLSKSGELYVCGPVGMLEAVKRCWRDQERPPGGLRFETFGTAGHHPSESFVVAVRNLGREFVVPRNRSLLEAIEAEGIPMISNCRRGECGVCAVTIVDADHGIDHRDVFLSDEQKAANQKMCTCVSRAVGGRLVIETGDR
nr:oxidoreductase [Bradyrhizobium sp. 1(2017)]